MSVREDLNCSLVYLVLFSCFLPPPRRLFLRLCLSVCLSVGGGAQKNNERISSKVGGRMKHGAGRERKKKLSHSMNLDAEKRGRPRILV